MSEVIRVNKTQSDISKGKHDKQDAGQATLHYLNKEFLIQQDPTGQYLEDL